MKSTAVLRSCAACAALVAAPAFADYVIAPSGGDITGARLSAQLADGDVTLTAAAGDVVVADAVNWNAHTLTLSAPAGRVNVNAVMTASGSAGLSLETDASEADGGVAVALTGGGFIGRVDFTGTGQSYRVNGTAYTLIRTIAELEAIRPPATGTVNGTYALAADVDWSGAASRTPLGTLGVSGRFDGLGHQLLDLAIPGSADDTGLFSTADGGAVIRNLGVRGGSVSGGGWVGTLVGNSSGVIAHVYSTADVSGTLFVGGLVGFHSGSGSLIADAWAGGNVTGTGAVGGLVGTTYPGSAVDNVWASGNVTGTSSSIGGLVGAADAGSTLRNAYATGNVAGSLEVGGLVGYNRGLVEHVLATGGVSASSNSYVGGLVGHNPADAGGSVSDGWFASDTSGAHPDNGAGTAIPLANLISALPGGFDAAVWANQNGRTTPYLQSVPGAVYVKAESAGAGSARVYTPVLTLEQLQAVGGNLDGDFALFSDLDASETANWNGGAGFVPIGNCAGGFNGRFDGLGHVVVDPVINPGSSSLCVGLFGGLGIGSVLRNVGVDGGSVAGGNAVGGLVGYNDAGAISNAFSTARVSASTNGGGLVGFTTGEVSDAYATGSVTVTGNGAGGLTGGSRGAIRRTWASGEVTGSGSNVGGLVGLAMDGSVSDSYWDSFSTGQAVAVGVVVDGNATVTNVSAVTSAPAQSGATNYAFKQSAYASLGTFGSTLGSATWAMMGGTTRPFLQSEYATTVNTAHQLQLVNLAKGASYTLGGPYTRLGHVDAGETGRSDGIAANSGGMWAQTGFAPLGPGGGADAFSGRFDGRHHVIHGLTVRSPDTVAGLFGWVTGGSVLDIGLRDVDVTGSGFAGGLAVRMDSGSDVRNVYVTGQVTAIAAPGSGDVLQAVAGGLVAELIDSSVDASYSTARVTAAAAAAGSYDIGIVGGLVGANVASSVSRSYASSPLGVIASPAFGNYVGELLGFDNGGSYVDDFWDSDANATGVGSGEVVGATGLSRVRWLSQGPIASGLWDTADTWVAGYPFPLLRGFPHVLVNAQGAHVTQGEELVTADSYAVIDQDGIDASAWIEGTPSWFADPDLAIGAVAHIGGSGVTMAAAYPFHEVTYLGSGVVQPPQAANLTLALTQGSPDYVGYGRIVDYVVTLSNDGSATATGRAVHASFGGGADVGATTWQCIAGSVDAVCTAAGNGPIADAVTIPPGVSMTWLIHVPVATATLAGTLDFEFSAEGLDPVVDRATIVLFRDGFDGAQDTNFAR